MRVLAPWMLPLLAALSQQPPTFRGGVSMVAVDAQVVDGNNLLTSLSKEDFVILENRKPQPILHFGMENEPLELLLLIDKSGSMLSVVAEIAVSALESLSQLRRGDRVGVMLFDTRTQLLAAPTSDLEEIATQLQAAVRDQNIGGGTDINGAVYEAARYMRQQPKTGARRSILILTDNQSFKTMRDRTVVTELWEADAVLNALLFESGFQAVLKTSARVTRPWNVLLEANVTRIVDQTGGESLRAGSPSESFRDMLDRIRKRYLMHYRAPSGPAKKARSIRVELSPGAKAKHPGGRVRARRGYIPPEEIP